MARRSQSWGYSFQATVTRLQLPKIQVQLLGYKKNLTCCYEATRVQVRGPNYAVTVTRRSYEVTVIKVNGYDVPLHRVQTLQQLQ